jgi:hypothetical protein
LHASPEEIAERVPAWISLRESSDANRHSWERGEAGGGVLNVQIMKATPALTAKELEFVDRFGLCFEKFGATRMMGKDACQPSEASTSVMTWAEFLT